MSSATTARRLPASSSAVPGARTTSGMPPLTYKNDIGDFQCLARVGYGESNDPGTQIGPGAAGTAIPTSYVIGGTTCISSSTTTASTGALRVPVGRRRLPPSCTSRRACSCSAAGASKRSTNDNRRQRSRSLIDPDSTVWFIQPGIEHEVASRSARPTSSASTATTTPAPTRARRWAPASISGRPASSRTSRRPIRASTSSTSTPTATSWVMPLPRASAAPTGKTRLDAFQEIITGAKINF